MPVMVAICQQDALDLQTWEGVPPWELFWTRNPPVNDPLLCELIESPPVQRLRRIGFLGAIDYLVHGNGTQAHRRRHNRFDHSVNVALLALRYARKKQLAVQQQRLLTTAALLHDIGHGPLSHTLEPAFHKLFGIDHHQAGRAIIRGTAPWGESITRILSRHGIDLEEIIALIDGTHQGEHAFLFHSPMNLDTIEAIARCCSFANGPTAVSPMNFVDAIASSNSFPTELGDRFWSVKGIIYQTLILSHSGLAADTLAQQYMMYAAHKFKLNDFYLDDTQLRRKHAALFTIFTHIRKRSPLQEQGLVSCFNFDSSVEATSRTFYVNDIATVSSPRDLDTRYTQKKIQRSVSLKSILGFKLS
jgi:uncharacterized protein